MLGLNKRGTIAEGNYADLVVFEPEKVKDCATYNDPHSLSEGIKKVMVNGEIAWDGDKQINNSGKVLRGWEH